MRAFINFVGHHGILHELIKLNNIRNQSVGKLTVVISRSVDHETLFFFSLFRNNEVKRGEKLSTRIKIFAFSRSCKSANCNGK